MRLDRPLSLLGHYAQEMMKMMLNHEKLKRLLEQSVSTWDLEDIITRIKINTQASLLHEQEVQSSPVLQDDFRKRGDRSFQRGDGFFNSQVKSTSDGLLLQRAKAQVTLPPAVEEMEPLQKLYHLLEAKGFQTRMEEVALLLDLCKTSPQLISTNVVQIFDYFVLRIADSHKKTKQRVLDVLAEIIGILEDALNPVIIGLVEEITKNLKDPGVHTAAVKALEESIAHLVALMKEFSHQWSKLSVQALLDVTDHITVFLEWVYPRSPEVLQRYTLPVFWSSLGNKQVLPVCEAPMSALWSPSLPLPPTRHYAQEMMKMMLNHEKLKRLLEQSVSTWDLEDIITRIKINTQASLLHEQEVQSSPVLQDDFRKRGDRSFQRGDGFFNSQVKSTSDGLLLQRAKAQVTLPPAVEEMEPLQKLYHLLEAKGFQTRMEEVALLLDLCKTSPQLISTNVVQIFDYFVLRIADSHKKTKQRVLDVLAEIIGILEDALNPVIIGLVEEITKNLKDPGVHTAAVKALEESIAHLVALMKEFSHQWSKLSVQALLDVTDHITDLTGSTFTKKFSLCTSHVSISNKSLASHPEELSFLQAQEEAAASPKSD
ncbi:hypothetical protein DUI87_22420 [Hirundo rustica rustica]|uniref:TOG domain-containing protein n=1 Tax=Hirundo rustica rustica TaxID=333673 RepID=A0A3M0K0T5_HIRRU|nr:hypothetical protein DUI87_22420 [Hirundo rustica rustica]